MRWAAAFLRWTEASRSNAGAKIVIVLKRNETASPTFWQLQAIGWIGLYGLIAVVVYTHDPYFSSALWRTATKWGIKWGICLLASCVLRPICRSLVTHSLRWFQLEIRTIGWCLLAGTSAALLILPFTVLHAHQLEWQGLTRDSIFASSLLFFWCNLYFSIKQWQQSAHERERVARAEADAREARLTALRYQLNPHFLFNSLNAVSTLVLEGDAPAATRMLAQIAELLRSNLETQLPYEVPLAEEVDFTRRYLAIEQTRMGERLQVEFAIATQTSDALVPGMLLQPLVENAIQHGVAPVIEGGKIVISTELRGSQLQIVVSNTGPRHPPPDKTSGGIGLTNTMERLRTLYGSDQRLDLQWPEMGGCEVQIEIPFRRSRDTAERLICAS